jgi:hypothetical protein
VDFKRLERKLKERTEYPYVWGSKQTNEKDKATNFIYKTYGIKRVINLCDQKGLSQELKDYAMTRWYNYHSAMGVESLFAEHKNVTPNKDIYDRMEDFKINGISFDHKTSNFPKTFGKSIEYAKANEKELIKWFYENQSNTKRNLNQNRLFIVMFDSKTGKHWKMKAEIMEIKKHIDKYMDNFDENNLHEINFDTGEKALASIIWIEK